MAKRYWEKNRTEIETFLQSWLLSIVTVQAAPSKGDPGCPIIGGYIRLSKLLRVDFKKVLRRPVELAALIGQVPNRKFHMTA
jgi:hypothetical protein